MNTKERRALAFNLATKAELLEVVDKPDRLKALDDLLSSEKIATRISKHLKQKETMPAELFEAIEIAKKELQTVKKNPSIHVALCYLDNFKVSGVLYGPEGMQTQLIYILANLQTWKGKTARRCKSIFKTYAK